MGRNLLHTLDLHRVGGVLSDFVRSPTTRDRTPNLTSLFPLLRVQFTAAGGLALAALLGCRGPSIPADSEILAPGVWHHAVRLIEGPWAIHVVEVDLEQAWEAGVRLQTARAGVDGSGSVEDE